MDNMELYRTWRGFRGGASLLSASADATLHLWNVAAGIGAVVVDLLFPCAFLVVAPNGKAALKMAADSRWRGATWRRPGPSVKVLQVDGSADNAVVTTTFAAASDAWFTLY